LLPEGHLLMTRKLIAATAVLALLISSAATAQPYPSAPRAGARYEDGRGRNGCFGAERYNDCRERLRAERRSQRHYIYRDGHYEDRDASGTAVAAGILGFILGAALAGSTHDRDYYQTHRNNAQWRSRCRAAYRGFDARTGTYLTPDGYRHYCTR
jgi:hypothetical protein